jgi:hypothetical protein
VMMVERLLAKCHIGCVSGDKSWGDRQTTDQSGSNRLAVGDNRVCSRAKISPLLLLNLGEDFEAGRYKRYLNSQIWDLGLFVTLLHRKATILLIAPILPGGRGR